MSIARPVTEKLLDMVGDGELDADLLLMACLKYMSEDEVRDMAKLNEFLFESELQ